MEFVVVSGIPGSGKTTLARQLQPLIGFPVIDKDDILVELFSAVGEQASSQRRKLSRESDLAFQRVALQADRAILVSFWHVPGMRADSGTPSGWVSSRGHAVLQLHCRCSPEVAARRFLARQRHHGHGDGERSLSELISEFGELVALGVPELGPPLLIDTEVAVDVANVAARIRQSLTAA